VNLLQSSSRAKKHRRVKPRELVVLVLPLIVAIGFVALVVVAVKAASSIHAQWLWEH
jgi:hypothetical protein